MGLAVILMGPIVPKLIFSLSRYVAALPRWTFQYPLESDANGRSENRRDDINRRSGKVTAHQGGSKRTSGIHRSPGEGRRA